MKVTSRNHRGSRQKSGFGGVIDTKVGICNRTPSKGNLLGMRAQKDVSQIPNRKARCKHSTMGQGYLQIMGANQALPA